MAESEFSYKLDQFEGPLDLLLHLVTKNKVDLLDIPIAEILRQYMEYMPLIQAQNLDNATEFTVMASALIYIKSRLMLPREETPEEDPRAALAAALAEYKKFKDIAPFFAERYITGQWLFTKGPENVTPVTAGDYCHSPKDLLRALRNMDRREERRKAVSREAFSAILEGEVVSVEDKTTYIVALLHRLGKVELRTLFHGERNRRHAVAAFLAVLDMIRSGTAILEDDGENSSRPGEGFLRLCDKITS